MHTAGKCSAGWGKAGGVGASQRPFASLAAWALPHAQPHATRWSCTCQLRPPVSPPPLPGLAQACMHPPVDGRAALAGGGGVARLNQEVALDIMEQAVVVELDPARHTWSARSGGLTPPPSEPTGAADPNPGRPPRAHLQSFRKFLQVSGQSSQNRSMTMSPLLVSSSTAMAGRGGAPPASLPCRRPRCRGWAGQNAWLQGGDARRAAPMAAIACAQASWW